MLDTILRREKSRNIYALRLNKDINTLLHRDIFEHGRH